MVANLFVTNKGNVVDPTHEYTLPALPLALPTLLPQSERNCGIVNVTLWPSVAGKDLHTSVPTVTCVILSKGGAPPSTHTGLTASRNELSSHSVTLIHGRTTTILSSALTFMGGRNTSLPASSVTTALPMNGQRVGENTNDIDAFATALLAPSATLRPPALRNVDDITEQSSENGRSTCGCCIRWKIPTTESEILTALPTAATTDATEGLMSTRSGLDVEHTMSTLVVVAA